MRIQNALRKPSLGSAIRRSIYNIESPATQERCETWQKKKQKKQKEKKEEERRSKKDKASNRPKIVERLGFATPIFLISSKTLVLFFLICFVAGQGSSASLASLDGALADPPSRSFDAGMYAVLSSPPSSCSGCLTESWRKMTTLPSCRTIASSDQKTREGRGCRNFLLEGIFRRNFEAAGKLG